MTDCKEACTAPNDALCALHVGTLPMGLLIASVEHALIELFETDAPLRQLLCLTPITAASAESVAASEDSTPGQRRALKIDIAQTAASWPSNANAATARTNDMLQSGFERIGFLLRQRGLIPGWRNECFSVRKPDGAVWFALERACFRPLGFISHAVHTHAWCSNGDTWLGRRAAHKATDPGLLDNLAAGGLSHGEEPFDCMVRELWEEAGVPETLARTIRALPQRILSERLEPEGMHREWLHCYTLALPDDFTPENRDGEVSSFTRCTPRELQALTASAAMTRDAALCANLALRCRLAE